MFGSPELEAFFRGEVPAVVRELLIHETSEGFKKAYSMLPKTRGIAMSLQDNDPIAVKNGAPKYKIMMIQIQLTM